jgi:hypothetical protein
MLKFLSNYANLIVKSFNGATLDSLKNGALGNLALFLHTFWASSLGLGVSNGETEIAMEKLFHNLFVPIVRQLAADGVGTAHLVVLPGLPPRATYKGEKLSVLLNLCLDLDFKLQSNADIREANAVLLAGALMDSWRRPSKKLADKWNNTVFLPWVDFLTAKALNHSRNIMYSLTDAIFIRDSGLGATTPEFVGQIVQKGGRINLAATDRTKEAAYGIYDEIMVELYFDALATQPL